MSMRIWTITIAMLIGLTGCVVEQRSVPSAQTAETGTDHDGTQIDPAQAPNPASRKLYLDLIGRLIAQGSYNAALAHLDEYKLRVLNDDTADLMRADVLSRLGRDREAAQVLRPFLKQTGNGPVIAKANKIAGRVAANHQQWPKAVTYFERARQAVPSDPTILNNLGYALAQTGDYKQAIQMLRQSYDLSPGQDQIRNNLIVVYFHSGMKKTAKTMFEGLEPTEKKAVSAMIKAWPEPAEFPE